MSIHGTYGTGTCENPECKKGKKFTKTAPHQKHCCEECRNHHTYLRTVKPRRDEERMGGK